MKKTILNRTLLMLMLLVSTFGFTSCGDDDEILADYNSLSGTWSLNRAEAKIDVKGLGEVTIQFVWNSKTHSVDMTAKVAGVTIPITEELANNFEGMYGEFTFTVNKAYTAYEYYKGKKTVSDSGTYELKGHSLVMNSNGRLTSYKITMNNDKQITLEFIDSSDTEVKKLLKSMTMVFNRP